VPSSFVLPWRRARWVVALALSCWLLCSGLVALLQPSPVLAMAASSLPETLPPEPVLDSAGVLSRSTSAAIARQLEALQDQGVEARLITIPRLDYGLGLQQLGDELLQNWQVGGDGRELLLLLIDTQTNGAALVASPGLSEQLGPQLLRSTARNTLASPLRDGSRYRQASLDAIDRLSQVLQGHDDPGVVLTDAVVTPRSSVPSREETQESKAWLWITVLLVVGTIVPMLTWWVFSR
jgi:uncharacterized protein